MTSILANRWIHNTLLALMMAVVILVPSLPRPEILASAFILIAWVIGEHYERLTVLDAGLVDREELKEAEREKRGWGFFS